VCGKELRKKVSSLPKERLRVKGEGGGEAVLAENLGKVTVMCGYFPSTLRGSDPITMQDK
jgi:hypothetical protein